MIYTIKGRYLDDRPFKITTDNVKQLYLYLDAIFKENNVNIRTMLIIATEKESI